MVRVPKPTVNIAKPTGIFIVTTSLLQMVRVPVMLAKCGINSGICDKECAAVELEEHTGKRGIIAEAYILRTTPTIILPHCLSLSLSLSHTHKHSLSISLSLSHTHIQTLSLSLTHIHTHITYKLSLSLSLPPLFPFR